MDVVNSPAGTTSIQFIAGSLAGRTYGINKPITILGRDRASDIVVNDPSVSRQHARLIWQNGVWSIEKLSPGNTLMLNQREVQQAVINHRDTISMGAGASFLFLTAAEISASSGVLSGPHLMPGALPGSQPLPPPPMTPPPAS